jgi:hypothetical protein
VPGKTTVTFKMMLSSAKISILAYRKRIAIKRINTLLEILKIRVSLSEIEAEKSPLMKILINFKEHRPTRKANSLLTKSVELSTTREAISCAATR